MAYNCLPFQIQFSHISGLAGRQKRVGNLRPFHRSEHQEPTNPQLYCSPKHKQSIEQYLLSNSEINLLWI